LKVDKAEGNFYIVASMLGLPRNAAFAADNRAN
jgi:hypothetical protein